MVIKLRATLHQTTFLYQETTKAKLTFEKTDISASVLLDVWLCVKDVLIKPNVHAASYRRTLRHLRSQSYQCSSLHYPTDFALLFLCEIHY